MNIIDIAVEKSNKARSNAARDRARRIWYGMNARCNNATSPAYHHYGGRGIRNNYESFDHFIMDVGWPSDNMQIDRINNDSHYEPGNCRWVLCAENARNKRSNKLTRALVSEIKYLINLGIKSTVIADKYNVSSGMVRQIRRGYAWQDIKPFPMSEFVKVY